MAAGTNYEVVMNKLMFRTNANVNATTGHLSLNTGAPFWPEDRYTYNPLPWSGYTYNPLMDRELLKGLIKEAVVEMFAELLAKAE